MLLTATSAFSKTWEGDVLVVPLWQTTKGVKPVVETGFAEVMVPAALGDFEGKEGEVAFVYTRDQRRLALLGLGHHKQLETESVQYAFHAVTKSCLEKKCHKIALVVPDFSQNQTQREIFLRALCEGIMLANYAWPKKKEKLITHLTLMGVSAQELKALKKLQTLSEGVYMARDLVNESAHTITPQYLGETALAWAKKSEGKLEATVWDAKLIAQHKMGLLMAVSQGSSVEPRFITLRYRGAPKSKDHTVLIGKGVTYDTGGLNLKPTGSMETMRCDMAGAATVLATVTTLASLKVPCNVTAVVPATENAIDARSYKPGDVFMAYDGSTVEIGNTDAEGRLILADAIGYSLEHLAPTRMIDFATLTGAVIIALGDGIAGFFSNDDPLADALQKASSDVHEPLWRLPLYRHYEDKLKSKVADISNVGGRPGGSIMGALFLKHFVTKQVPWAHIDFAGPAFLDKEFRLFPRHAVGFGVRLMVKFFEDLNL